MVKRSRDDDEVVLDPAVQEVLNSYESTLATFMSSLSSLLSRYTQMLQAALPHNPKACYYFVGSTGSESTDTKGAKVKKGEPEERRVSSPLLARQSLPPQDLKKLMQNATEQVSERTGSMSPQASRSPIASPPPAFPQYTLPPCPSEASAEEPEGIQTKPMKRSKVSTNDDSKPLKTVEALLDEVKPSPLLLEQSRILSKEGYDILLTFDQIHDWIAMKAPEMKAEDNMGVAIMGSVISEIASLSTVITAKACQIEQSYISKRAKLEIAFLNNAACATQRALIEEFDSSTWDDIEAGWRVLMRGVVLVHSLLSKNMKTLRAPRERRTGMSV